MVRHSSHANNIVFFVDICILKHIQLYHAGFTRKSNRNRTVYRGHWGGENFQWFNLDIYSYTLALCCTNIVNKSSLRTLYAVANKRY